MKKQFGVIPYIARRGRPQIVLITSKTNGYWIFPKGNIQKKRDSFASAQQEAFEEGGLIGKLEKKSSYSTTFQQAGEKRQLTLYPMRVEQLLAHWPEQKERSRRVVSAIQAIKMIEIDGLRDCLEKWLGDKK